MNSLAMTPAQLAMLSGGIVLFIVSLGLLIFLVAKGKPVKGVLVLFPVAIIMIGFPSFTHVDVLGVSFDEAAAKDYVQNPNNPAAIANYQHQLANVQQQQEEHPNQALPKDVRSRLDLTVDRLKTDPKLTPESRSLLSQTRELLARSK